MYAHAILQLNGLSPSEALGRIPHAASRCMSRRGIAQCADTPLSGARGLELSAQAGVLAARCASVPVHPQVDSGLMPRNKTHTVSRFSVVLSIAARKEHQAPRPSCIAAHVHGEFGTWIRQSTDDALGSRRVFGENVHARARSRRLSRQCFCVATPLPRSATGISPQCRGTRCPG